MTSEVERLGVRDRFGNKNIVICECLVQLSVVAELQEVAGVLALINNTLSWVQRQRK